MSKKIHWNNSMLFKLGLCGWLEFWFVTDVCGLNFFVIIVPSFFPSSSFINYPPPRRMLLLGGHRANLTLKISLVWKTSWRIFGQSMYDYGQHHRHHPVHPAILRMRKLSHGSCQSDDWEVFLEFACTFVFHVGWCCNMSGAPRGLLPPLGITAKTWTWSATVLDSSRIC